MTENKTETKQNTLSLYVHIPFCVRKCAYCDFLSMPAEESLQKQYVQALLHEIEALAPLYENYEVVSLFLGGGTPSVLSEKLSEQLMNTLHRRFRIEPDAEVSMEVNPGTVNRQKLKSYVNMGINRLSIGMQSTVNETLKKLGRIHTFEQFLDCFFMAKEAGFENINVDVMSALPGQTLSEYCQGLKTLMALPERPTHISSYSLILEEGTPFYERFVNGGPQTTEYRLPDEDTERKMYEATERILSTYGYHRYEISNYALPGYECRHNKRYWTREEYVGFGIGAASFTANRRWKNSSDIHAYIRADGLAEKEEELCLSVREQMEEFMFLGLRLMEGIHREDFYSVFGVELEEVYGVQIASLKEAGLLREDRTVRLTKRGIDLSNYVFEKFLE